MTCAFRRLAHTGCSRSFSVIVAEQSAQALGGSPLSQFVQECRPPLQKGIGEAELEDGARDGLERRLVTGFHPTPGLFATGIFEPFQALGLPGRQRTGALARRSSISPLTAFMRLVSVSHGDPSIFTTP